MRFHRRIPLTAVVLALALSNGAPTASAVIRPGGYESVKITLTAPQFGKIGSYVACPTGKRAVAGGAYWHRAGQAADATLSAVITASGPTDGMRQWFGGGYNLNPGPLQLSIVAFCLPAASIGTPTLVRVNIRAEPQFDVLMEPNCPANTKLLSAGVFWSWEGPPLPDMSTPSSMKGWAPKPGGAGFWATGRNSAGSNTTRYDHLWATLMCSPPSVTGTYSSRTTRRHVAAGAAAVSTANCPPGQRVVTGGTLWQRPAGNLDRTINAGLVGSAPNATATGWSGWGKNRETSENLLVTTVLCAPA